jgi:hypothetical protein
MASTLRRSLPFALVGVTCAWLASAISSTGDWGSDSWPAVHALSHGQISTYLSAKAMMGPFSTLVQAPFTALSSGGELAAYRLAAFPCLLAAGLLGLYLAAIAARRGASRPFRWLLAVLCLLNPLTLQALEAGHPEELLTAALAIGAVASAAEGHTRRTALLLGLAVASKQWAVVAILPALMALPRSRVKAGLGAAAIAVALMLPSLVAAPGSFGEVSNNAAHTGGVVTPWSVWYPEATTKTVTYDAGSSSLTAEIHRAPPLVGALSHPLIVVLAIAVPLALALRRRRIGILGEEALALLALLALMRCALDPVDNLYYHAPLLLALLGWDAFAQPGRLPLRGLVGVALALVFWRWSHDLGDVALFNAAYVAVVLLAIGAISVVLFRPRFWFTSYSPDFARSCTQT